MSLTVAASLWSTPREHLDHEARRLVSAGLRRWHWDVSDGSFAAPGGFDVATADRLGRLTGLPGEAHLMVGDPVAHVDGWSAVCDTVIVHVEANGWADAVERVLSKGRRAGVAISPTTPLTALATVESDVAVLVMSIPPGTAGSAFDPTTLERLAALADGATALGVDGGITAELARACADHGAAWVVSGSSLCGSSDPRRWLAAAEGPS